MPIIIPPAVSEDLEGLSLAGLDLNSATFSMESLSMTPPAKRPEWISGADSDGALLSRDPTYDNRVIEARIRVAQQASHDAVVAHIGSILDKLQECSRNENGLNLVWDPANSTADEITFHCLMGEITDLPIDWQDSGRFVNSWAFTIRLTCLPFGEGVETLIATVTSSLPLMSLELADVMGDVRALARLVVLDAASQARRWIAWGMESRWYPTSSPPALLIDSTSMVTTGYAGVTGTRSGAYSGGSNNVITATLRTQVQAICGLGNLSHVGNFRPQLRCYASATTVAVRLTWQALDGPFRALTYKVPVTVGWNHIDLGQITVPETQLGTQRWTGLIEAYSTGTGGETFEVDYVGLMPAELFGRARGSYAYQVGALTTYEDCEGASGALGARTAPLGGAWTTSGGATDWAFGTLAMGGDVDLTRTAGTDASPRIGVLGSSVTNVEVQADLFAVFFVLATPYEWGVIARHSASTDYLRATLYVTNTVADEATATLRVTKRVAGTDTVIGSQALPRTLLQGDGRPAAPDYPVRLVVFSSGRCIATVADSNGAEMARVDVVDTAMATGGALASGKCGVFDYNTGTSGIARGLDNFYTATPPAEPIACHSAQTIEFRHDTALREDSTGTYAGSPPEYVGSRFFVPNAGGPGRKARVAVMAKRNDVATAADDNIADSTTVSVYVVPRYLAIPR